MARCRHPALVLVLICAQAVSVGARVAAAQAPGRTGPAPERERTAPARGSEVAGSILAVVAVGAAGFGVYQSVRVGRLARDIEQSSSLGAEIPAEQIDEKVEAGERAELWQWIGYGTALAAGATAAVLLLWPRGLDDRGTEPARAVALPWLTTTGAGAAWRMSF